MTNSDPIQQLNRQLAEKINQEARNNPHSPYVGKFVGIAGGQVVAVADNLDDLMDSLQRIEPDPSKVFSIEAGLDYTKVQEIWSR